jgi:Thioredoxin reductase
MKNYDIIVVGGGPAGMTAALYSLRNDRKVLVLEKENFGGQIAISPRLENFPSIKEISGMDFSNNLFEQITSLGAEFNLEDVLDIKKENDSFIVKTNYNTYSSKIVMLATGVKHRHMGIAREEELVGHGVSYCATCDGAFYKNEDVVVIGDANSALQYALMLSNYCKSIHICTLFDKWFADKLLVDQLSSKKNITYEHNLSLKSFDGEKELTGLTFVNTKTNEIKKFNCKGVFIAIGQIPDNKRFENLVDLDKNGFIITNDNMETKTPGLYAIGDCRQKDIRQVVTALNDGAIAAVIANKYLQ